MKKVILVISVLVLVFSSASCSEYEPQKKNSNNTKPSTTNKIEYELEKCIEKNYQTDLAMASCYNKAIEKSEFEINSLINKLKGITTKEQYSEIIKSQEQWNEFIKQDNHTLEGMFEIQPYLMPYLISATLKYQNVKKRLEELKTIYSYQKDYILPNN